MTKQGEVRDWHKDMKLSTELHGIGTPLELEEIAIYWMKQAAAEKKRADKAERKENKLKQALEHCIEQYPLYDSKEIAASLMIDFMKNILSILYPLAVLGEEETHINLPREEETLE